MRLRVRRGKSDWAGEGAELGLPRGRHAETCPVRAFEAWQAEAKRRAGPLFRQISTGDTVGDTALHPDAVRRRCGCESASEHRPASRRASSLVCLRFHPTT